MRIATQASALPAARERSVLRVESAAEREVVALFDQLRAPLLRYTLNFGVPVQEGEEVVQEVFLALFRHLQDGKPRENLRGWVFRVAHNLALKRRAALANRASLVQEDLVGESALFADPAPSPEDRLANVQLQEHLLAVFRVLPEQDRRCLILRAEGLRYREIARVLGMSLGAVSMSLSRSLARLARAADR